MSTDSPERNSPPPPNLGEIGLTPEEVRGRKVLFLETEPMVELGEVIVIPFDLETFLMFDQIVPDGQDVDLIIARDTSPLLNIAIQDNYELISAAIMSLSPTGEMRIARSTEKPDITKHLKIALADEEITDVYGPSSYLVIKPKKP